MTKDLIKNIERLSAKNTLDKECRMKALKTKAHLQSLKMQLKK